MQRICAKDHGGRSVHQLYPSKSFIPKGPLKWPVFEHFGLEQHFNMAAMIVFTPKCPLEGDVSRLECTSHDGTGLPRSTDYPTGLKWSKYKHMDWAIYQTRSSCTSRQ